MQRPKPKKIDALRVLAKASLADRKRRPPWRLLLVAVPVLALVAGLVWWIWPSPRMPRLVMAALDQVAAPDETVRVCARVEPEPSDAEARVFDLSGCDLYFTPHATHVPTKVVTNRDGTAYVELQFPEQKKPAEVVVRYPGQTDLQRGAQAEARIFVWPPQTAVLVVDADRVLAKEKAEVLWAANNLDIHPQPGAAAALRKAAEKYQVVYLTAGADRPILYNKVRAWLRRSGAPAAEQFPNGPVLARTCQTGDMDEASFQTATLRDLKKRFHGPALGITRRLEDATRFQEAGFQTYLVAEVPSVPEGVTRVKDWKELAERLAK